MSFRSVAIFWDYENCSPTATATGYDIVNALRHIGQKFGPIKTFKAYVELAQLSSPRLMRLRSELQASGVSLTDCPHHERKDVADKMILVDMLAFCIDNPAPATIILISGDRDFAYALSTLQHRQYHVVLVAPPMVHASLTAQVSSVVDWHVLRRSMEEEPTSNDIDWIGFSSPPISQDTHASPTEPHATSARPQPRGPALNVKLRHISNHGGHDVRMSPIATSSAVTGEHLRNNDRTPPSEGVMLSNYGSSSEIISQYLESPAADARPDAASKVLQLGAAIKRNECQNAPDDVHGSRLRNHSLGTAPEAEEHVSLVRHAAILQGNSDSDHSAASALIPAPIGATSSTRSHPLPRDARGFRVGSSLVSEIDPVPGDRQPDPMGVRITQPLSRNSAWVQEQVIASTYSSPMPPIVPPAQSSAAATSAVKSRGDLSANMGQLLTSPPNAIQANVSPAPRKEPSTSQALDSAVFQPLVTQLNVWHQKGEPRPPYSKVAQALNKNVYKRAGVGTFSQYAALAGQAGLVKLGEDANKIPWISHAAPEKLQPLLIHLKALSMKGTLRPSRSDVAQSLVKQDRSVYRKAGVTSFRQYTALAEKEGLVELGVSGGGEPWISLAPAWRNA